MGKVSKKAARDNHANQLNPQHPAQTTSNSSTKATADNRSNQPNPKTDVHKKSRGLPKAELHEAADEEDDD
jgi:hypothetical protein